MQRGTTAMDTELPVKLTDDELIERAQTLAAKMLHVETLRRKKAEDSKNTQALIDSELDECQRLARVISGQEELRRQGDLFIDQAAATESLAAIAEKAGDHRPADEHVFVSKADGIDVCVTCESNAADPVHEGEPLGLDVPGQEGERSDDADPGESIGGIEYPPVAQPLDEDRGNGKGHARKRKATGPLARKAKRRIRDARA